MVCDEEIGWRNNARRVIIFTTDQSFHIAMDGKLGGLVVPNDGLCHLDYRGSYTHSTIQDYPSIGHINHVAKAKSVSIIWAVTEDKIGLYWALRKLVEGSEVGKISRDSSNIVDIVREQYHAITTSIKVESNSTESACNTDIIAINCNGGDKVDNKKALKHTAECKGVPLGTSVEFELGVVLNECKSDVIVVSPVGLRKSNILNNNIIFMPNLIV